MHAQQTDPVLETLLYPVRQNDIVLPAGGRILLANPGVSCGALGLLGSAKVDVCQHWKSKAEYYRSKAYEIVSVAEEGVYDIVFVSLPKQREEALYAIAQAYEALKEGAWLVVAAANDAGGRRLKDDLAHIFPDFREEFKNKCRVVWLKKRRDVILPPAWTQQGSMFIHSDTGYWTQAGLFSWDRVDPGTALLMAVMENNLTGCVVDAGCGAGVLGDHILKECPGITELICIDADSRAVEACRRNITGRHSGRATRFLWEDFSGPMPGLQADHVIMNPPFHTGSEENVDLGRAFICNAAGILRPGGGLRLVANAHLRYEDILREAFSSVVEIVRKNGFKVIHAVR